MTSFLSRLSPIPAFPAYTGPYQVGTQDVEIPVKDLSSFVPSPDPSISTVSFRIFYPCQPGKNTKPAYWLPTPQSQHFRAYARFMSASQRLSTFLSYLPIFRTIFYTTIPAFRDAQIAIPPSDAKRWPVMVFSHGLGGSRNVYSHITGSLASHGMVVIAAEHRDGSAPISFIHSQDKSAPRAVDYHSLPHTSSPEVEDSRNQQLKIRLWELGSIHDALLKIDEGYHVTNVAPDRNQGPSDKKAFKSLLDVHTPGKISWAGHSFGAATIIQFLKSVYHPPPPNSAKSHPIYAPPLNSAISKQITPSTPIAILDLWALPLNLSRNTWLQAQPLPAYVSSTDGTPPLAILSEAFFRWKANLQDTKSAISPPTNNPSLSKTQPLIFYPISSAHLSQSDFGPLFPFLTKKIFKAEEPQRTLLLNVRAILESLRRSGIKVADTSARDMEVSTPTVAGPREVEDGQRWPLSQDHEILVGEGRVRGWVAVPLGDGDEVAGREGNGHVVEAGGPGEAVMEGEVMKG